MTDGLRSTALRPPPTVVSSDELPASRSSNRSEPTMLLLVLRGTSLAAAAAVVAPAAAAAAAAPAAVDAAGGAEGAAAACTGAAATAAGGGCAAAVAAGHSGCTSPLVLNTSSTHAPLGSLLPRRIMPPISTMSRLTSVRPSPICSWGLPVRGLLNLSSCSAEKPGPGEGEEGGPAKQV